MPATNQRIKKDAKGFFVVTGNGQKIYGRIEEHGEPLKVEDGVVVSKAALRVYTDEVPSGDNIEGAKIAPNPTLDN